MTTEEANKTIKAIKELKMKLHKESEELKAKYTVKCVRYDIACNDIESLKVKNEQLEAINKILEDAVNLSVMDYEKRKMTYGWHDLEYNRNKQAQKQVEEIRGK